MSMPGFSAEISLYKAMRHTPMARRRAFAASRGVSHNYRDKSTTATPGAI
jgi:hypothetical protein